MGGERRLARSSSMRDRSDHLDQTPGLPRRPHPGQSRNPPIQIRGAARGGTPDPRRTTTTPTDRSRLEMGTCDRPRVAADPHRLRPRLTTPLPVPHEQQKDTLSAGTDAHRDDTPAPTLPKTAKPPPLRPKTGESSPSPSRMKR